MENKLFSLEELNIYIDSISTTDFMRSFTMGLCDIIFKLFPTQLEDVILDEHKKSNYIKYMFNILNYYSVSKNRCLELVDFVNSLDSPPSTQQIKDFILCPSQELQSSYISKLYEDFDSSENNSSYDSFNKIAMEYLNYKRADIPFVESEKSKTLQKIKETERELLSLNQEKILVSDNNKDNFTKRRRIGELEGLLYVLKYRVNWLRSLIKKLSYK